ncbi:hypothetical protein DKX38_006693 [Salix brachista]|uniref:Uncharacterized protein n=1 Tax=Salix brachista TaxID=2182728 RepID=A0A5N5N637_9ROSI|nr:hypothetical protein DKX38_006693 [Salix brachista]
MASEGKISAFNNPGPHTTPDEATRGYIMRQTLTDNVGYGIWGHYNSKLEQHPQPQATTSCALNSNPISLTFNSPET